MIKQTILRYEKWFSNQKNLGFIYALLLLVVPFLFSNLPLKAKKYGDATFHVEAKIISAWLHGDDRHSTIKFEKAPGPSLFYAIPYFFLPSDSSDESFWRLGLFWNYLVVLVGLWYLNKTLLAKYGGRSSLMFFVLSLLIPLHFYYATGIIAEPMAFFAACLISVSSIRLMKNEDRSSWMFLFGSLLLLFLARPNTGLVFGLIFLLGILGFWKANKVNLFISRNWRILVLGSTVSIGLILSLSFGIRALNGHEMRNSQQDYLFYVAHAGRFQFRKEPFNWTFWDSNNRAESLDYLDWQESNNRFNKAFKDKKEKKDAMRSWIFRDAVSHPFTTIKQFLVRSIFGNSLMVNSLSFRGKSLAGIPVLTLYYLGISVINFINFAILFLAIRFAISNINGPMLILVSLFAALLLFHGFIYMEQRYMFPMRPIILFSAAIFGTKYMKV